MDQEELVKAINEYMRERNIMVIDDGLEYKGETVTQLVTRAYIDDDGMIALSVEY